MRDIKFRAWDGKKMHRVCRLGLDGFSTDLWSSSPVNCDIRNTESLTLMQYTGLKDRNGKEIFEGDIIQEIGDYGETRKQAVVYGDGCWVPLVRVEYGYNAIDRYDPNEFEVVGNIYEGEQ